VSILVRREIEALIAAPLIRAYVEALAELPRCRCFQENGQTGSM